MRVRHNLKNQIKMYRIYSIFIGSILIGLSVVHGFVVTDIESKNLTIHTLNEAVNRLTLNKSAIYRAFVTSDDRVRNIILKQTIQPERRNFFGLIIIPYIICFFAAKGFWPFYPAILQYQVNEMGRKVFSLSDDRIQQFCHGKFNFPGTCFRPDIFVPTTDCPPGTTGPWTEAPARWSAAQKTSKAKQTSASSQKTENGKDVEVFGTTFKAQSANAAASGPKSPLENFDGDKQPNINIEIHNVFSFADTEKANGNGADNNQIKVFKGQNKTVDPI